MPAAENILMGGFWSGISQTSSKGGKRSSIDQARMQMIQQYLAAVLNFHFFGSIGEPVLAAARAAYCGTNESAIQAQIGILGNLNQNGDSLGTTPGGSQRHRYRRLRPISMPGTLRPTRWTR
jgi:hypothetical protein